MLAEKLQTVPLFWQTAIVALIPKEGAAESTRAQDLRPIYIFPALWRAYAKVRFAQLSAHLEPLLRKFQYGNRPSCSAVSPIVEIGQLIDNARLKQQPLHGVSLDLTKMFDTLPLFALGQLIDDWQIDKDIGNYWMKHFRDHDMRFRVTGSYISHPVQSSRGLPQGCPLSVAMANAVMSCVGYALEAAFKDKDECLSASIYIDDINVITSDVSLVPRGLGGKCRLYFYGRGDFSDRSRDRL